MPSQLSQPCDPTAKNVNPLLMHYCIMHDMVWCQGSQNSSLWNKSSLQTGFVWLSSTDWQRVQIFFFFCFHLPASWEILLKCPDFNFLMKNQTWLAGALTPIWQHWLSPWAGHVIFRLPAQRWAPGATASLPPPHGLLCGFQPLTHFSHVCPTEAEHVA